MYDDKRGNGEVAIASEWDVREEFGKSTFFLVLGNINTQLIYILNLNFWPIYITKKKKKMKMLSVVGTD